MAAHFTQSFFTQNPNYFAAGSVPSEVYNCTITQHCQIICAVKSHSRWLAIL